MSITPAVDFVVKDAIAQLISRGHTLANAAEMVGSSKRQVDAMMREDPEFREAITEALARMIGKVDKTVFDEAVDGSAKHAELFYKRHVPEMMAPQSAKTAQAPQVQVAQLTVLAVQQLITGDQAPQWLEMLHSRPEAIEAEVVDGAAEESVDPS